MSKPKRRVTVDAGKSVSDDGEKQKPSVFERLGPGGGQRKYNAEPERTQVCRHWALNGTCHFGSKCKFSHKSHRDSSPEESRHQRKRDRSRSRNQSRSRSESRSPDSRRSESISRRDKMKSAVVVRKSKQADTEEDSEDSGSWNLDRLDYKKELELEKKRQQLQRELSQLAGSEDEPENLKIQKRVAKNRSDSDSSPERLKPVKKVSKISPFKMKLDKKNKLKSSPLVTASLVPKPVRAPSPQKIALKLKEQKKKSAPSEDEDSPRTKLKIAKKLAKQIMAEKSIETESPIKKKKHSPRSEKKAEKMTKVNRFAQEPLSPVGKRRRSKSPSRSPSPVSPIRKQKKISPKGKDKIKGKKKKMDIQPPVSFDRRSFSPERKSRSHSKGRKGKGGKKKYESSSSSDSSSSSSSSPEVRKKKKTPTKNKEREKREEILPPKKVKKVRKKSSESPPPPLKMRGSPPRGPRRDTSLEKRRRDDPEEGRKNFDRGPSPDSFRSTSSSPGRDRRGRNQSPDERRRREREEQVKRRPERSPEERRPVRDEAKRPDNREDVRRHEGRDDPRRPDPREEMRRPEGREDIRRRDDGREDMRREGRDDPRRMDARDEPRRDGREDIRRGEGRDDIRRGEGRDDPIRRGERDDIRRPERDDFRRGDPRDEIRRPEFDPRRSPLRRSLSPDLRRDRDVGRHGRPPPDFRPGPGERGRYDTFPDRFDPDRRIERDVFGPRDRGRLDPAYERERDPIDRYPPERPRMREDTRRSPPFERPGYHEPAWDRGRGRGWGPVPRDRGRGRGLEGPPPGYDPPLAPGPYIRGRYPERDFGGRIGRREWDEWDARRDDRREIPREHVRDDRRMDDRLFRDDGRPPREPWIPRDERRPPDFREDRLSRRDGSMDRRERDLSPPFIRRPDGRDERPRDHRESSFDRGARDDRGRDLRDRDDAARSDRGDRDDDPRDKREGSRNRGRDEPRIRDDKLDDRRGGLRDERDDRFRRDKRDDRDDAKSERSMEGRSRRDLEEKGQGDRRQDESERESKDGDLGKRDIDRSSRTSDKSRMESRARDDGSPRDRRGVKNDDEKVSRHSEDRGSHHERESRTSDRSRRRDEEGNDKKRGDVDKISPDKDVDKISEHKPEGEKIKSDSRKRQHETDRRSISPVHKRSRDISPAHSSRSYGSAGGRSQSSRSRSKNRIRELKKEENRSRSGSHDRLKTIDQVIKEKTDNVQPPLPKEDTRSEKGDKGDNLSDRGQSKRSRSSSKERKSDDDTSKKLKGSKLTDDEEAKPEEQKEPPMSPAAENVSPDHKSSHSLAEDENQLDQSKEVFSDWSDDDEANDILIQEPAVKSIKDEERKRRSPSRSSRGSKHSHQDERKPVKTIERTSEASAPEKARSNSVGSVGNVPEVPDDITNKDLDSMDDEAIDYDSISSEEENFMDEDGENKKKEKQSIVDVLDIDWSSLQKDTRPKPTTGSALNRFKPHNILSQIGVSRKYAGEVMYKKVIEECQKQLDLEHAENNDGEKPVFKFEHDIAAFHSSAVKKIKDRANLIKNVGPFRRALCARRDLEIRRQLCKVDKCLDQAPVFNPAVVDTQLHKLSIQYFKQARDGMSETKEPVKAEISQQ
ncbi:hypothetical protein SNE40_001407 [Patella caerulea]|uniref:C3H1-type domain-containing protein n=1 Tax=Patella caerulea TaxID=87958 RepID=A0AAN8Q2X4_PATCE